MKIRCNISPFSILNAVQFLAAVNENYYKLLIAYFLIHIFGQSESTAVMSMMGALFILPFLIFSSLGGILADKWSKNRILVATRLLELIALMGAYFFLSEQFAYFLYAILFMIASFSAVFGPTKYSLIPELLEPHRHLFGNSVIAAFTYLGIIVGTALPSLILWMTDSNYAIGLMVSIGIALAAFLLGCFLPHTPAENGDKPLKIFIYSELWASIKQMVTIPSLTAAAFAYSYFLFLGSYLQLSIIPYTEEMLGLSEIDGGYFFLLTAFGLGLGAFFTQVISREKILLGIVPLSGLGISGVMILMYLFYSSWKLTILWMLLIGFLGGLFLVPPQAFILEASPIQDRGRNFATVNFLSFSFALLAAGALYFLNTFLGMSPATSFLIISFMNIAVMLLLIASTNWLQRGSNRAM